jgi:hemerythrin-like domain-containing protein
MLPIGPLMIEHRLIERMIGLLRTRTEAMKDSGRVDAAFIEAAVDFIRTYADRTHHGKEEEILFRDLGRKALSAQDRRVMLELVKEHTFGRQNVRELAQAAARHEAGDRGALEVVILRLGALVGFYPKHIEKEDRVFFPAAMGYLDRAEKDAMLSEMREFDRKMIHEKYAGLVEGLEKNEERACPPAAPPPPGRRKSGGP